MPRDYYEVLGISRDAGETDIKKRFRQLARELHPDVNAHDPEAESKFKECAEAYEVLSDPERRATYDRYGHDGLRSGGYAPNFDAFGSVSDLFDAFFGGGGAFGGRGGALQGGDVAVAVEIELADVIEGKSVEVSYDAVARCEHCHGNGAEPGTPIDSCERCAGAGRLRAVSRTVFGQVVREVVCDACGGDGKIARQPCGRCRGEGRSARKSRLSVDIPAGIDDGQRIRISGRGHEGDAGGPAGDLYVLVRVREDRRFVREGAELVTSLDVPAPLAALGTRLEVQTLDGPVEVHVAPGTQPGETIRLREHGLPSLRGGRRGELHAVVNVVIPRRLSESQQELLRTLADSMTEDNLRSDESVFSKLKRALRG